MTPVKIVTVIGARPQFIKASILSKIFRETDRIHEIIIHTGQHFDFNMDRVFFDELHIPVPAYNLNINSMSHGAMTGNMLSEIEKILNTEKPEYLLVYGDTNSTLAGALAAKKLHIKVIHVEAGLRSYNQNMPEEINRILTDRLSDILFCPTGRAVQNLRNEGFDNFPCIFENTGDVMYDLALFFQDQENSISLGKLNSGREFVLCTIHREENTADQEKLSSIINGLNKISEEMEIILPLHPRTRKIIEDNKLELKFQTADPIGYLDMMKHLRQCKLVITDSGGLQKESFFYKKFCITLREETEWTELVDHGYNKLVGSDATLLYKAYKECVHLNKTFKESFYGTGQACRKILNTILDHHSDLAE